MLTTTKQQKDIMFNEIRRIIKEASDSNNEIEGNLKYIRNIILRTIDKNKLNVDAEVFNMSLTSIKVTVEVGKVLKELKWQSETEAPSLFKSNVETYLDYLIKYRANHKTIAHYTSILNKLSPHKKHNTLIKDINFAISKAVLRGGKFPLGIGLLYIHESKRTSFDKPLIDYDASNKNKEALIAEGKVPYDKYKNPDGVKYIVFFDREYDYWWDIRRIDKSIPNAVDFSFMPSNTVNIEHEPGKFNTPSRRKEDFLAKCETNDDIIDRVCIGTMNKLRFLLTFDKLIHLKYRANGQRY